ncbi:MAG: hypothetical protein PVJ49_05980 [Acidobacteriota bacterium]|jgi:hypothetical protein
MEILALIVVAALVLGAPALGAVAWRRSLDRRAAGADAIELVAVAYGGVAVAALSIWIAAQLAGPGWRAILLAIVVGTVVLLGASLVHSGGRADEPLAAEKSSTGKRHFLILALAGALFALLAWLPFINYGLQRADGIHRMAMTDWYKHLVTTTALVGSDAFPPANPFLHAVDNAPYYYGFHLVAASIGRLAGALTGSGGAGMVYPALLLLTLVTAAATPFVVYAAARTIAFGRGTDLGDDARVPLLAALGGTFLAGFDLIPLIIDSLVNLAGGAARVGGLGALRAVVPSTHLDYWIHHNERQFNAPYMTVIWAPQHMAAVLVALLAVHLVLRRRLQAERVGAGDTFAAGWLLPALLLAGLPALSAYVALGLAIAVVGATLIEGVRRRRLPWHTPALRQWLLPGLVAAVLALPVAAVLAAGRTGGLTVHVSSAGRWSNGALLSALFGPGWLSGTVDSIAVYAVELGVIGVLAALEARRLAAKSRLQPHQRHVLWMSLSVLVVVVFVRPPVGMPNNLYARPLVLVWCMLAPFAALRLARVAGLVTRADGITGVDPPPTASAGRRRGIGDARWALVAVALCLLANGYALVGMLLEGRLFWATLVSTVEATRWVDDNAPRDAVVAIPQEDFVSGIGYFLRRPLALADERHALLFGANGEQYARVAAELRRARATADPAVAAAALRAAGGTLLLLARADGEPVWLRSSCFTTPFENDGWIVAVPIDGGGCAGR